MQPWSFYDLTPPANDPEPDLVDEHLSLLEPAERAQFHKESESLCDALQEALDTWLDAHPINEGPWMWANATDMLAYCFRENLKEFMAEIMAEAAAEDCDA